MTAVNVSMFSPASGPDLANATAAEVIAAIMKEFSRRPKFRVSEINDWLVAHGCRRFRFTDFVHDQFELVEVKP